MGPLRMAQCCAGAGPCPNDASARPMLIGAPLARETSGHTVFIALPRTRTSGGCAPCTLGCNLGNDGYAARRPSRQSHPSASGNALWILCGAVVSTISAFFTCNVSLVCSVCTRASGAVGMARPVLPNGHSAQGCKLPRRTVGTFCTPVSVRHLPMSTFGYR